MSVAIVIPESWEPSKLILWSTTIARAKNEDLLIFWPKRQVSRRKRKQASAAAGTDASPFAAAIREHARDFTVRDLDAESHGENAASAVRRADSEEQCIFLRQMNHANLVKGVLKEIKDLRVNTLIVPRRHGVRFAGDEFAAERELLSEAPCETMQLLPGQAEGDEHGSILVASSGSKNASPALDFGAKLAASQATEVTALYVEQEDAPTAQSDGQEIVERFVRTSLGEQNKIVKLAAVVDKDVSKGLSSYAAAKGHHLIVVGGGGHRAVDRPSRARVSEQILAELDEQTVVVVRSALPWTARTWKLLERFKKWSVPQLDRDGRVGLVNRLHSDAQWNFDFFFLISLATMLAALGLSLNSAPVVIGAMLVAPLMAPMLGVGLSLVQGNRFMANDCLITIQRGFLAAFLTGCAVGIVRFCFTSGVTEEMSNRGAPGILDLLVAFVSGVVAAYAFGRPHLLSVVPGIAIATSLVPPVATAGLALSSGHFELAVGATLLFLSNFVAIVLGSAISLWFVGIRGPREFRPFAAWARRLMFGMFAAAVCLALYFSTSGEHAPDTSLLIAARDDSSPPSEDANVADRNPAEQQSTLDVAAGEEDEATNDLLVEQELQHVQVVFKPRVVDGREPTVADVTLIVPNEPRPVELEGIVAEERKPGWVVLDLPPRERWERQRRWLTLLQRQGLESPSFFDLLEKHIAKRFAPELSNPM